MIQKRDGNKKQAGKNSGFFIAFSCPDPQPDGKIIVNRNMFQKFLWKYYVYYILLTLLC